MSYPVTYYCPQCETLVALDRDGYLADKTVTPYPLEGWTYVDPTEPFEDDPDVDGVRFVCGESEGVEWDPRADDREGDGDTTEADPGCGEPFYLSFVRHENGREVEPRPEAEQVAINPDPRASGPRGPDGPGRSGGSGGFW
ncbi:hypothetical protein JCM17823_25190 [Halorubrum gandharaense]